MQSLAPKCRPAARLTPQILVYYHTNMSRSLPMSALVAIDVKYSTAYSMGRELLLEPFERAFAVVPNR